MDVCLGFDTSCYTTSVAAVDAQGNVLAFERLLLPVQSGQRGLRQSEAVFAHVRRLPSLVEQAMASLGPEHRLIGVAASAAPREGSESYMPVFTVGDGYARALAASLRIPYYPVTHQQGHIAAGTLGNPPMEEQFVAVHLSGGTTDLLLSLGDTLTMLGSSLDLHAGQLIDRIGVAMGLPFPAGPALESLALDTNQPAQSLLPASLARGDLDCHFSGAETRCMQWIQAGDPERGLIAKEVFDLLARTVARMVDAACRETGTRQALVVGGVSSSMLLREWLTQRLCKRNGQITLCFGQPRYSADNAAGVAWLGMRQLMQQRKDA